MRRASWCVAVRGLRCGACDVRAAAFARARVCEQIFLDLAAAECAAAPAVDASDASAAGTAFDLHTLEQTLLRLAGPEWPRDAQPRAARACARRSKLARLAYPVLQNRARVCVLCTLGPDEVRAAPGTDSSGSGARAAAAPRDASVATVMLAKRLLDAGRQREAALGSSGASSVATPGAPADARARDGASPRADVAVVATVAATPTTPHSASFGGAPHGGVASVNAMPTELLIDSPLGAADLTMRGVGDAAREWAPSSEWESRVRLVEMRLAQLGDSREHQRTVAAPASPPAGPGARDALPASALADIMTRVAGLVEAAEQRVLLATHNHWTRVRADASLSASAASSRDADVDALSRTNAAALVRQNRTLQQLVSSVAQRQNELMARVAVLEAGGAERDDSGSSPAEAGTVPSDGTRESGAGAAAEPGAPAAAARTASVHALEALRSAQRRHASDVQTALSAQRELFLGVHTMLDVLQDQQIAAAAHAQRTLHDALGEQLRAWNASLDAARAQFDDRVRTCVSDPLAAIEARVLRAEERAAAALADAGRARADVQHGMLQVDTLRRELGGVRDAAAERAADLLARVQRVTRQCAPLERVDVAHLAGVVSQVHADVLALQRADATRADVLERVQSRAAAQQSEAMLAAQELHELSVRLARCEAVARAAADEARVLAQRLERVASAQGERDTAEREAAAAAVDAAAGAAAHAASDVADARELLRSVAERNSERARETDARVALLEDRIAQLELQALAEHAGGPLVRVASGDDSTADEPPARTPAAVRRASVRSGLAPTVAMPATPAERVVSQSVESLFEEMIRLHDRVGEIQRQQQEQRQPQRQQPQPQSQAQPQPQSQPQRATAHADNGTPLPRASTSTSGDDETLSASAAP